MMQHMVIALVAAGLLVASAPVAPVAGAAEGRHHYVVVPDNVYWGNSVRFTNGRPTGLNRNMTVQVKVTYPQEIDPVSYRDIVIEEAVTGDGRNLVPPPAGGRAQWRTQERPIHKWGGHMGRRNSFNLAVSLAGVDKPPKAIKRLKGSFTLDYSEGFTEVEIGSPRRLEKGKRIEHDDLGDHQVFFLGADEREVRFRLSYAANKILNDNAKALYGL